MIQDEKSQRAQQAQFPLLPQKSEEKAQLTGQLDVTMKKGDNQMEIQAAFSTEQNPEFYEKQAPIKQCPFCQEWISTPQYTQHQQICQIIFCSNLSQQENLAFLECELCKASLTNSTKEEHQNTCLMKDVKCHACGDYFIRCHLDQHTQSCPKLKHRCKYCRLLFNNNKIMAHEQSCPSRYSYYRSNSMKQDHFGGEFEKIQFDTDFLKKICKWCLAEINTNETSLTDHEHLCNDKLDLQSFVQDEKQGLAPCQSMALSQIYKKTVQQNFRSIPEMKSHIFQMNYQQGDLFLMSKYIEEMAPIIIHFNMQMLSNFFKDTHYRNLFQTNTSGGSKSKQNRKSWENYLFGNHYDGALDSQRVKYGVMNFMNDHQGIASCKQYGSSFMVLGYSVRKRCTITHTRMYAPGEIIGTLKYNFPILSRFTRKELQAIYYASQGFEVESKGLAFFKQIQIHGPIDFRKHVECIYSPKAEIDKNIKVVKQFVNKFKVSIHPIEEFDNENNFK